MKHLGLVLAFAAAVALLGCSKNRVTAPGSGPLDQWVAAGPTGGYIQSLAVRGTTLFAGTLGGGLYRSTDNGASWRALHGAFTNPHVGVLAVSGTSVFAASGGLFRSTDNGASWTELGSGNVAALAVRGTILFGVHAGETSDDLIRSADNGATWNVVLGAKSISRALGVSGTSVFAQVDGRVLRSTDDGATWTAANSGLTGVFVVLAASGASLFAGTSDGVFRSDDEGMSWTPASNGLTGVVVALAVNGSSLLAGTAGGVFRSDDNGSSWVMVNNGLTDPSVRALGISGTNLFAATYTLDPSVPGGGVFRSTDNGVSWTAINGLMNQDVRAFATSGTSLFTGTDGGGVFRSNDNGTSWTAVNSGLSNLGVLALAVSGTSLFAGTHGGVFRSDDNGSTWTLGGGLPSGGRVAASVLVVSGSNLFAACSDFNDGCSGVFRSTDGAASWTDVTGWPNPTGLPNATYYALAVSGTSLFASAGAPCECTTPGLYRSSDNGATWTASGLTDMTVSALAVNGPSLFAATVEWSFGTPVSGGAVFRSTDNGASWADISGGLKTWLSGRLPSAAGTSLSRLLGTGSCDIHSIDPVAPPPCRASITEVRS